MNVMRFDAGVGDLTLDVQEESVQLLKGMGTICLQLGLEVKAPPVQEVGRLPFKPTYTAFMGRTSGRSSAG